MVWVGSPNYSSRKGYVPRAIVLHTMDGTLAGTDSWFGTPASQVSAHYGVGEDGAVHQYVDEKNVGWANGILEQGNRWPYVDGVNPNLRTISIETEDFGTGAPVSSAQEQAVRSLVAGIVRRNPSIVYLVTHSAISPKSRPSCPGPRWTSGKMQAIARVFGLTLIL